MMTERPDALNAYRNSFNAVRLIAAVQVLVVHSVVHLALPQPPLWHLILQFPGVPIFFSLSGFLVLDSFIRLRSVTGYFAARALRIYPALLINIAVLETLFYLFGGSSFGDASASSIFAYEAINAITASDVIGLWASGLRGVRAGHGFFPFYPSGVLWTLTVELSFYATVGAIGWFANWRRIGTAAYAALAFASLAYLFLTSDNKDAHPLHAVNLIRLTFFPYYWMFATGMIFRLWVAELSRVRFAAPVLALILLVLAATSQFEMPDWKYGVEPIAIAKMLALCLLALFIGVSPYLKSAWLSRNDISYGVYLWHMLFVATALGWGIKGHLWTLPATIVLVAMACASGWLSMRYIEQPVRQWRKQHVSNRVASPVGAEFHRES
jgi:peptidoglycan/LPS O-acetylase OafA/YrhL